MSGGHYNYICHKSFNEISEHGQIEDMLTDLANFDYASDLHQEIAEIMQSLKDAGDRWNRLTQDSTVLYEFEYWQSGDHSEESFKEALEAWREKKKAMEIVITGNLAAGTVETMTREGPEGTLAEALQGIRPECPGAQDLIDAVIKGEEK